MYVCMYVYIYIYIYIYTYNDFSAAILRASVPDLSNLKTVRALLRAACVGFFDDRA